MSPAGNPPRNTCLWHLLSPPVLNSSTATLFENPAIPWPLTSTNYKKHSIPGRGLFNWSSSLAEAASPVFAFLPFLLFLCCLQSLQHRTTTNTPTTITTPPTTTIKFQGLGRKDMKSFSSSALSGTWTVPGGGEGVTVTSGKGVGVLVAGSGTTQEKIRTALLRQSRNVTLIYQYACNFIL